MEPSEPKPPRRSRTHRWLWRAFVGVLCFVGLAVVAVLVLIVVLRPPEPLAVPPRGAVFANVTVVEPGRGRRAAQTVRVEGGRIASVEPWVPADGDHGAGGFLLPGLIDMHVHSPDASAPNQVEIFSLLYVAHGITTVRDTGNFDGSIQRVRDRIRAGEFVGPRVFACGPIHDGDPPVWPGAVVVTDVAAAKAEANAIADQRYDCLKVYERLRPEVLAALRDTARARGLPVVGHIPAGMEFENAGIDDVQHLRALPGPYRSSENLGGFLRTETAPWSHLTPERIDEVVRISLAQGISHTPTLVVLDRLSRLDDYAAQMREPAMQLLPRVYPEIAWDPSVAPWFASITPLEWKDAQRQILPQAKRMVLALQRAGVPLHAGSDTMNPYVLPGVSLHEEIHHLVDAGLTPEEALVTATQNPGKFLREPGLGTIAPGAPADLVLYRKDPTQDAAALETREAVVVDGRLYSRAALDAAVATFRDYVHGWTYDHLLTGLGWLMRERGRAVVGADPSRSPAGDAG